jgi:hypothetical protein
LLLVAQSLVVANCDETGNLISVLVEVEKITNCYNVTNMHWMLRWPNQDFPFPLFGKQVGELTQPCAED